LSPGAFTITQAAAESGPFAGCEWRLVDAGYFRTLRIPLVRGRLFESRDDAPSPRVFVISQQLARTLYGEADPIGKRLRLEGGGSGDVIGVVADVRMRQLGDPPERVVYFPPSQFGFFPLFNVVVRAAGPPDAVAAVIRDSLKALDPALAAYDVQPMRHWVDRSAALMRIRALLIALLGAQALLLGVIGVYGVMACVVAQRTREFGIRMALGARPWALPFGVVAGGLRVIVPGIACGLLAAIAASERLRPLLFGIDPRDPWTLTAVAAGVALVAASASYVPARRAAAADPLVVLRAE
jgi:ABC-type antimicrobial peptide transport system permease subunit